MRPAPALVGLVVVLLAGLESGNGRLSAAGGAADRRYVRAGCGEMSVTLQINVDYSQRDVLPVFVSEGLESIFSVDANPATGAAWATVPACFKAAETGEYHLLNRIPASKHGYWPALLRRGRLPAEIGKAVGATTIFLEPVPQG